MKEIKDYLHLYLGCEMQRGGIVTPALLQAANEAAFNIWEDLKPILRPLSSLTKHESNIGDEIMNTFDETNAIEAMQGMANMTMYLLKQGFDLFNLIPEGLAIDASTLINKVK